MDGNEFLLKVGVDTSPAEKDLASFINKINSMRNKAASSDATSSSPQLPPQVAASAFSDAPIDLSKQTSDLKEQAKIQRQIVQDRGKLVGLLQEEARIAGSIDSKELNNIRQGAEDALATAFGSGKLSASLKGALTKAINETVAAVRVPDGKTTRAQELTAKTNPAPPERFVSRSTAVLKTVGIEAPTVIRPNVDIVKDFNKAISSSQGDVLAVLNSVTTSFGKVVAAVESLAGNFASAGNDQGKALDDMTSSMTETAKTVGKINNEILKNLANRAKKAAIDSQKTYGARQKEVIKTVVDNPGISYEELKATGAPAQTIQSLTNRGLKRTGDNFDVDVSALTNFDAELTKVLSEFVGPVAGSLTQIQELQDSVKRLVSGVDTVAVEAEKTAQAVARDGLFGEKGKAEPVRKGTVPQNESAPAKKEEFTQTNFLAQEQTIEDAIKDLEVNIEDAAKQADGLASSFEDGKEQIQNLTGRAFKIIDLKSDLNKEAQKIFDDAIKSVGGDPKTDKIVNSDVVSSVTNKTLGTVSDEKLSRLDAIDDELFKLGEEQIAIEEKKVALSKEIYGIDSQSRTDQEKQRLKRNALEDRRIKTEEASGRSAELPEGPTRDAERDTNIARGKAMDDERSQQLEAEKTITAELDATAQWEKDRAEAARLRAKEVADAVSTAESSGLKTVPVSAEDFKAAQESRFTIARERFLDPVGNKQYVETRTTPREVGENQFYDYNEDTAFIYDPKDIDLIKVRAQEVIDSILSEIAQIGAGLKESSNPERDISRAGEQIASIQRIANSALANEGLPSLDTDVESTLARKAEELLVVEQAKIAEEQDAAQIAREQNAIGGQITAAMEDELKARREAAEAAAKAPLSEADKQALANAEQPTLLSTSTLDDSLSELERELILAAERVKAIVDVPVQDLKAGDQIWRNSGAGTLERTLKNPQGGIDGRPQVVDYVPDTNYPILGDASEGDTLSVLKKVDADRLANGETALSLEEARTVIAQKLLETEAELAPVMAAFKTEQDKALVLRKELNAWLQKRIDEQGLEAKAEDVNVFQDGEVYKKSGPGSRTPLFKLSKAEEQEYRNRAQRIVEPNALTFTKNGPNTGYPSFPRGGDRILSTINREYESLAGLIRKQIDSTFEASVTLDQLNGLLSSTALSQEEIDKVSLIILDKQRKSLEGYLINNPNRTDTDANPDEQSVRQQAELDQTLNDINRILGLRKEAEEQVVKAVQEQAVTQENINKSKEVLVPSEVIQPSTETKRNYPEYDALRDIYNDMIAEGASAAEAAEDVAKFAKDNGLDIQKLQYEGAERIGEAAQYLSDDWLHNASSEELRSSLEKFAKEADTLERIRQELDFRQENPSELRGSDRPVDVDSQVKQQSIDRYKEYIGGPDEVIPPPESIQSASQELVATGEAVGQVIDALSATQEEMVRYAQDVYGKSRADRAAAGTRGTEPIVMEGEERKALMSATEESAQVLSGQSEVTAQTTEAQGEVGESAKRLSASMDESLTSVRGLTPAMLAVIDILESMPLSLKEFKNSFGSRITSFRALNERGVINPNDEGKYTVAPREEIPGLFKASSDRKLEYKKSLKTDAIAEAKAQADALIEEYGVEVVQAFNDNLEYFTEQYVNSIETRIEALEFTLGDTDNDGAIGNFGQIPAPLINKDLYQRFGETLGAEWDFYVQAFLEENAPGLLNFQGTKFNKADVDSILFSESDPEKQLSDASKDIGLRSATLPVEDYLAETNGLNEANLSIDEYISQVLELNALSEELRNISAGLSGLDISTAMGMFGDQLEVMASESVEINEQIALATRAETEAKLQAIAENRAALQVYKEAFEFANGDDFSELSIALQEALQEDLRRAAAEANAVLRANEPILGQASTVRTINVDEGQAIDNLIGIQNSLENKIFDEAVANLAPLEDAQQLLVNEVVDGAKIEAQTNEERLKNLGKTKAAQPVSEEVSVNGQFVDGETSLVTALARKIEALDQQSSVLENIYPSFEEAERELVYALNRKRQLLDQQSKSIEDAGVTLPSLSEIDPFQSGGSGGGPKYGVNPYDTMNPGGSGGGGSGKKSGLVGEDEDGFDPVEAALARIEAAEKNLLTNIALFSVTFEESGELFADKLAELQAGVQGFNAALEGKTLIELINQPDSLKNATQGGAEKLAGESLIEGQTAAELLAEGNEDLLFFFVEGQKLLAASMQQISEQIFNQSLEADKRIRTAWENAETAFTILTQTNAESGEKLSDLFSEYTSKLAVFNQELSVLTKEGITSDPELLGRIGEAKGRSRIADTTIAGQANQSIINTILNDPEEEGGERNLVDELLAAQIALIESTSQLAELRNEQIIETREVLEQLVDEDVSISQLKNARERLAQSLLDGESLRAGAEAGKLALSRSVEQKDLLLEDPAFIQLRRRQDQQRSRERRAILGEEQAPGLTGRLTRYFDYQPDRGGAGFKQFFGGGALAAARYGIPGQILRSGGQGIVDTIKEAEELQFALARLEGQFKTVFPEGNFADVRGEIKAVAVETGLAADEIANFQIQITGAFSDVEIGGVGGTDLIKEQTLAAAKLAQTVGLPLNEITDGLTAASLAFGENFERIGDVAVRLEERSGVLAKETIAFIGDIAPVAEEAGYSLEEFSALAAVAQQRSGRSGAALAESFGRVIPALAEQKDKLMELAQITPSLQTPGFIDAIRQSDSKEILDQIGQAYQSMGKDAQQATVAILGGRREAQALIPALANRELVDRLQKDAENSVGSLDTRFEDIQKTLTNSLARLGEAVRGFGVELLESGLTDVFELAIGLAEKLLSVLTPIAGIFADINKSLGGVPAVMTALLGAGAALNNVAFRPETEIITDPITGAETSQIIGREFVGTDFIQSIGQSIKENFTENFDRSAQQSLQRNIQQGQVGGQPLDPSSLGPLFAGGFTNDDSKKLITRGQKLKAAGTGLLGTIGGGSAALGAGLVGITALSTAFGFVQGQIDETQAALDDLILETQNQITDTDLNVDGARERLTENLRVQAEDAREGYDGWTKFFGELGNNLNPGDYLEGQENVIGASDDFRDALKIFDSSDSLRKDIFKEFQVTLGKNTGGLRDIASDYKETIDETNGFIREDAEGAFRLYNSQGEEMANAPIRGMDAEYLNNLSSRLGVETEDLDFGFVEASLQRDADVQILSLAKGEEEALNKYGLGAQEQAIQYVELLSGLGRDNPKFAKEIDALLKEIGKLPPLESNKIKGEELRAAYDVGVISFEEYSSRLIENIAARRRILETGDQNEASELELLQLRQQEQAAYREFAEIIIQRQEKALKFDTVLNGLGDSQQASVTRQNNLDNLNNPNFNDRDLREQAVLDIIEADKQIAINAAIAAGDAARISQLLNEGVDVSPIAQAIAAIDSVQGTDAWAKITNDMTAAFNKLFGDVPDIENWYEKILADAFDDGQLNDINKGNILSRLDSVLGSLNAASFDDLDTGEQDELEGSFDQLIMLLSIGGAKRSELLAALARNSQYEDLSPAEIEAALDEILERNIFEEDPKQKAKIDYNTAKEANSSIYGLRAAEAKGNKILAAEAKRDEANANRLAAEASKDAGLISQAKQAQIAAEMELQQAYSDAQVAKLEYYSTIATINGNLIGAIDLDIQALERQRDLAIANDDQPAVDALNGQIATAYDNRRKQIVADANALSDLFGGLATLRGDLIQAATFALEVANRNVDAARTPEEKAAAALAQAQANADLINSWFAERSRDYNLWIAAFSSLGLNQAAAQVELSKAQDALKTAIQTGNKDDIAQARIDLMGAEQEIFRAGFADRARNYEVFETFLGSRGFGLEAAQVQLIKAKDQLETAKKTKNEDDIAAAKLAVINAEAAVRDGFQARADSNAALATALAGDDPARIAQIELERANAELRRAQVQKLGPEQINAAKIAVIEASKARIAADNDIRIAMMSLRQAEAQAIEDEVGAAQIGVEIARQQLKDLINANAGAAAIAQGRAALITADKAAKDAVFNERQEEYKWLLDMGQISKSQYINYLEGLKSTLIPGSKQFRDLELAIRQLKNDIGGDLQANLPTSLRLPTLYEIRRMNQGTSFSSANGASSYSDNRSLTTGPITIASGMDFQTFMNMLAQFMGTPGTTGSVNRRY